jgi:hypothetical protein
MYQLEIISPNMSTICFDDGDEGPPAWYPSVDPPKSHWENMSKCWNVGIFPMEMATFGEYVYCIILYYIILYYIILSIPNSERLLDDIGSMNCPRRRLRKNQTGKVWLLSEEGRNFESNSKDLAP